MAMPMHSGSATRNTATEGMKSTFNADKNDLLCDLWVTLKLGPSSVCFWLY
jgi:hypothetical protein